MTQSDPSASSPVLAGLRQRCHRCGKGKLFASYLKFNAACPVCGEDFSQAETGDGPAFFVSFGVLIITAPFFFMLPMLAVPLAAKIIGTLIIAMVMVALILWLLPAAKAVLLNLQLHHKAGSGN